MFVCLSVYVFCFVLVVCVFGFSGVCVFVCVYVCVFVFVSIGSVLSTIAIKCFCMYLCPVVCVNTHMV